MGIFSTDQISFGYFQGCPVREKVLENEKFSRSGKSQGITFSVREILKKKWKKSWKSQGISKFPLKDAS